MSKRLYLSALVPALLFVGVASAQQYPVMDMVADKVIQKYQQSSCEQLWQRKGKPKPQKEKRSAKDDARRPADARRIHQQGGGADRQQDVRMRDDSVTTVGRHGIGCPLGGLTLRCRGEMLLLTPDVQVVGPSQKSRKFGGASARRRSSVFASKWCFDGTGRGLIGMGAFHALERHLHALRVRLAQAMLAAQSGRESFAVTGHSKGEQMAQIDAALMRIVDGRYGVCFACGRTIAIDRLRLLPVTLFCLRCARRRPRVSPIDAA